MSTSGLRPATKLDFSPKGTTSTRSLPRCTARRVVQGCRGSTHHAGVVNPPAWGAGGLAAGCGGGAAAGARGSAAGSRRLPPNICDGSHARFSSILFRRSGEPVRQLPPPRDMLEDRPPAERSLARSPGVCPRVKIRDGLALAFPKQGCRPYKGGGRKHIFTRRRKSAVSTRDHTASRNWTQTRRPPAAAAIAPWSPQPRAGPISK